MQVAATIPAFVVVPDTGPDLDVRQVADDDIAQGDVLLDDPVLSVGQCAGLAQDVIRDADLADVVQQTGHPEDPDELLIRSSRWARKTA